MEVVQALRDTIRIDLLFGQDAGVEIGRYRARRRG